MPRKASGGTLRSRASAIRLRFRCRTASCMSRGILPRIISRWPCSQRVRWLRIAVAELGKCARNQRFRAKTSHVAGTKVDPSFMSSTMCPLAKVALLMISQERPFRCRMS